MIAGIYASIGVGSCLFTFHIRSGIVMGTRYFIVYNCIDYALKSCHFCGHVYVPKTLLCIVKVIRPMRWGYPVPVSSNAEIFS